MAESEKLKIIEDSLEKGLAAMLQMAEALHLAADGLDGMTEHYVKLAGCGDCGHWDPEKETEVIAARKMVADIRAALIGVSETAPSAIAPPFKE